MIFLVKVIVSFVMLLGSLQGCSGEVEEQHLYTYTLTVPPPQIGREISTYESWSESEVFSWESKLDRVLTMSWYEPPVSKGGFEVTLMVEPTESMVMYLFDQQEVRVTPSEGDTEHFEVMISDSNSEAEAASILGTIVYWEIEKAEGGGSETEDPITVFSDEIQGDTFHYSTNISSNCDEAITLKNTASLMGREGLFMERSYWGNPIPQQRFELSELGLGVNCENVALGPDDPEALLFTGVVGVGNDRYSLQVKMYKATEYKRWSKLTNSLDLVPVGNSDLRLDVELRDPSIIVEPEGFYDSFNGKEFLTGLSPWLTIKDETTGREESYFNMHQMYIGFHHYGVTLAKPNPFE